MVRRIEVHRESILKRTGMDGEYGRLVSCSAIPEGRIHRIFEWDGRLYTVTYKKTLYFIGSPQLVAHR